MPPHQPAEDSDRPGYSCLLAALDPHPDRALQRYLHLYQKLLRFFEWRGCSYPEEATDTTLDRVNRKIDQGTVVSNMNAFIAGVATCAC